MPLFRRKRLKINQEIDPDEIFLDSENLPAFDIHQFEGRLEKPISMMVILIIFLKVGLVPKNQPKV